MDADAHEPEPSHAAFETESSERKEGPTPPRSPARRRSSSAPGEWSRADHSPGGASRRHFRVSVSVNGRTKKSFGDTQLMRPEWLVDVPPDLARAWCVLPRPEGRRALVVASRGARRRAPRKPAASRAASRRRSRRGSRATQRGGGEGGFCILDCVFHEPDATYYVLDTLAWNGVSLYDCAAEMRAAWTHAKLGHPETAECPEAGAADANTNAFRFAPLPVYDADAAGIRTRTTRRRYRSSGTAFCSSPRTARTSSASRLWRRCGKTRGARGSFWRKTRARRTRSGNGWCCRWTQRRATS